MAKIACPTVAVLRPEPGKSLEDNLEEMFKYIANMAAQTPNDFTIQLSVPLAEMPLEEMEKIVTQAAQDVESMEGRILEPHGIDSKDGTMTYKLKGQPGQK